MSRTKIEVAGGASRGISRAAVALALAAGVWLAIASAAKALPGEAAVTATGTVARVQSSERSLTVKLSEGGEARFVWDADTRITGVLTPGARVTVRYVTADGGANRALQITVSRN
jgi:hypothetical protein